MIPRVLFAIVGPLIVLTLLILGIRTVNRWHEQAQRVPVLEKAIADIHKNFKAYRDASEKELARMDALYKGYADENATLRRNATVPAPVIRVCNAPAVSSGTVPAADSPAAGSDAATTGTGSAGSADAGNPGALLGQQLIQFAREDDQRNADARLLQAWARTLPKCEPITVE